MPPSRVKLHGFNNLTKTLSFNIYDICYANSTSQVKEYIQYIDEIYNTERLTKILKNVADIIGANILNIARHDYEPEGASVTMLVSEEAMVAEGLSNTEAPGPLPEPEVLPDALVAHLDKSHLTVHTYPESHPENGISTFRADIDVSTCGRVSPLKALNFLIHSFAPDIVTMDYRVRGFTRDVRGRKHYIDHPINSIQNFMASDTRERYEMIDVNVYQENIFHTKMMQKDFRLDSYLFGVEMGELSAKEQKRISQNLRHEMLEIFYGRNISKKHRFN